MSKHSSSEKKKLEARRVPCLVAFLHPFRIVNGPESLKWFVSLDQINATTWDYIALHEMVGGIDVGLESPYHMVACRDGGLALPPVPELLGEQAAVDFFNRCFAAILLGGIYCESITLDGLDFGSILDWKYVRVESCALAAPNRFHFSIRGQHASPMEAIALEEPRNITVDELSTAAYKGRLVLDSIPNVGGEFLLKGVTGYARRDWGTALANLWIVVEQLTSHLWSEKIIDTARITKVAQGRVKNLSDNRTWTISARHEMLFQLNVFNSELYASLIGARKSRNLLTHDGEHPDKKGAADALFSVKRLLGIMLPEHSIPFLDMNLEDHTMSDPFEPRETRSLSPKYWMKIKKLPGEEEIERIEAELRGETHECLE